MLKFLKHSIISVLCATLIVLMLVISGTSFSTALIIGGLVALFVLVIQFVLHVIENPGQY